MYSKNRNFEIVLAQRDYTEEPQVKNTELRNLRTVIEKWKEMATEFRNKRRKKQNKTN